MKFAFIVVSNDKKRRLAYNPRKKTLFDDFEDEIVVYGENGDVYKKFKKPEHRLVIQGEVEEVDDGPAPFIIDSPFYKSEEDYEAEHFWDDFDNPPNK